MSPEEWQIVVHNTNKIRDLEKKLLKDKTLIFGNDDTHEIVILTIPKNRTAYFIAECYDNNNKIDCTRFEKDLHYGIGMFYDIHNYLVDEGFSVLDVKN